MLSSARGRKLSARQKVIFAVTHSSAGGAQELWVNIAEAFSRAGHEVRLVALYPDRKDVRQTPDHLPWHYAAPRRAKRPLEQLRLWRSLVGMLREFQPDAVFTALPAANVALPLAVRLAGGRARVVTSHHAPVHTNNPLLDRADGWVGASPLVHRVVCVSRAVEASLAKKSAAYRRKSRVITNALPPEVERRLAALAAQHPHTHAKGRTIVATGRLAAQKNYPALVRAARHLPETRIRIVGTGPDRDMLEALATELGVAQRVEFLGFRQRQEALAILAQADLFVQPSLYEGHSLALVEAIKLGLPVVVSDVPSQLEGITDANGRLCGMAVDPHLPEELAAAITSLLDDPQKYADYARRSTALGTSITFDAMIAAYLQLLADETGVPAHG
nr:glycosyltransferase [Devosia oryzisoli]